MASRAAELPHSIPVRRPGVAYILEPRLTGSYELLIERDDALAELAQAVAAGRSGPGTVVLVTGDAGVGKTSVVRAATNTVDLPVSWSFFDALATPVPGGPLRELSAADPVALDGLVANDALSARDQLLGWLRAQPRIVVVEDAHWADGFTSDVLRSVARRMSSCRGTLIVTSRPHPTGTGAELLSALSQLDGVTRVRLEPLSAAAVGQLAEAAGHSPERALTFTGGNPFLLAEFLSAGAELPESVVASVAVRMSALSAAGRAAVERASVIPRREHAEVFADLAAGVDEAVAAGILVGTDDVVCFRHELIRLAAESSLAPMRRRACHADVLRLIRDQAPPAVSAYHAERCGERNLAVELHAAAGHAAERHGAPRQAVDHWARALQLVDGGARGDTRQLLRRLSRANAVAVGEEAAYEPAWRVVDLGDPDACMHAEDLCWLSRVVTSSSESAELLERALDSLPAEGGEGVRAMVTAMQATNDMLARRLADGVEAADRALELAQPLEDSEVIVAALQARGCSVILGGDRAGVADIEHAIRIAETAGLTRECARAHINLVSAAGESCLYDVVDASTSPALDFVTQHDADAQAAYLRAWVARCAFERGRWVEASGWIEQVLQPETGSLIATVLALSLRGRLRARRGDPGVWQALNEAYARARETGLLQRLAPVVAARAEARWLKGAVDDGTDGLVATYELACTVNHAWTIGELGLWMHRHGHLSAIDPRAAAPYRLHVEGSVDQAALLWTDLGRPYDAAEAQSDSSDPAEIRNAHAAFLSLGAAPAGARAARRLRELGARSIPRGPYQRARSHPDGLTRREDEVVQLVREGYTDAEIAQTLHLSAKTVSQHVSASLRKLEVTSRRQLIVNRSDDLDDG